jgi:hypothetical protein
MRTFLCMSIVCLLGACGGDDGRGPVDSGGVDAAIGIDGGGTDGGGVDAGPGTDSGPADDAGPGDDAGGVDGGGGGDDAGTMRTVITDRCAPSFGSCEVDFDCMTSGCGGEMCADMKVATTCDCVAPAASCGCVDGMCAWYR